MTAKTIIAFGECMAELDIATDLNTRVQFSGDVYNSLVYAKRSYSNIGVRFASGVGYDHLSQLMLKNADAHDINTSFILKTKQHNLGLYTISTDETGYSSFWYYRKGSAASQFIDMIGPDDIAKFKEVYEDDAIIYFSGISLAIYSGSDRDKFLFYIAKLKEIGFTIAFSTNFRSVLWRNKQEAVRYISKCYSLADIVFTNTEDQSALFEHQSLDQIMDFLKSFDCDEIVVREFLKVTVGLIKQEDSTYAQTNIDVNEHMQVVDSTATTDSFDGVYLASRLNHNSVSAALTEASDTATMVAQHKGAIVYQ